MKHMSKNFHRVISTLQHYLSSFDIYGQEVNLTINGRHKFRTSFGGLSTIVLIVLITHIFSDFFDSWLKKEKMTIIPSSISYNSMDLLAANKNYSYQFNYQNYGVYWMITAELPNRSVLQMPNLTNYFTYKVIYWSEAYVKMEIPTGPCRLDYIDTFLGLDEILIEKDKGKLSPTRICIQDEFKMGIFPDPKISFIRTPGFSFYVYQKCVNSTENNNSCASQEAIDQMISYTYVRTIMPTTTYDFNN